jgi:serine/threonine-protein kinase
MNDDLRLQTQIGVGDAKAALRRSSSASLPADVLRDASRRLGWAALVYSITYSLAFLGGHFAAAGAGIADSLLDRPLQLTVAITSILLGLGVFWVSRKGSVKPQRLLDFGLVFQVVGALGIAFAELWGVFPEWRPDEVVSAYVGVSWTGIWILIFPILAPNTPWKILSASLVAASMAPLVVLLSIAAGATSSAAPLYFFAIYFLFTTYLCAGIAYFVARIVYHFGVQLREARDVGSYRLVERLGIGGMGEVWRAEHRLLVRPAAVKLIRAEVLGTDPGTRDSAVRRFEREAQATSSLRSIHTVELYDFGLTDEGLFYYVMELLDGLNLERLVKRFGATPPGRTIHLLRQVCRSLGEAHEREMVHRDIKPANIFTCRLGPDHDFVKVLDFGLVKVHPRATSEDAELTAEGSFAGTPAFIAPEIALGEGAVDGRADLYAVGCVGYWLLTGMLVFEASTPMGLVVEHLKTPPVRPSERTELEIPADLEALVMQCLAKEPGDRPGDAWALDGALAACAAAGEWGPDKAEAWWRLHQAAEVDAAADVPIGEVVPA